MTVPSSRTTGAPVRTAVTVDPALAEAEGVGSGEVAASPQAVTRRRAITTTRMPV
jgi:hypothetical protein